MSSPTPPPIVEVLSDDTLCGLASAGRLLRLGKGREIALKVSPGFPRVFGGTLKPIELQYF